MDSRKVSNREEPLSRKNLHRGRTSIAEGSSPEILLTTKIINYEKN